MQLEAKNTSTQGNFYFIFHVLKGDDSGMDPPTEPLSKQRRGKGFVLHLESELVFPRSEILPHTFYTLQLKKKIREYS